MTIISLLNEFTPARLLTSRQLLFVLASSVTIMILITIQYLSDHRVAARYKIAASSDNFGMHGQRQREAAEALLAEAEFADRLLMYEKLCSTGIDGGVSEVYYHLPSNLSVCHVPKTGCTFWKRIFHFLYNETGYQRVSSPFDIDRYDVHFQVKEKVKIIEYGVDWKERGRIDNTNKILFTRDPYTRLWSVYLDKFLLPDSWLDHGMAIVQRRRNKTDSERACADNVAFPEFLQYAISANYEPHVLPVHKVCNPCRFQPRYVGKMETFSRDVTYLLTRAGLQSLVQGFGHPQHVQEEVRMLTGYHFRLYESRPGLRQCVTHSGLAARLWKAFVLNGYIGEHLIMPEQQFMALDGVYTRKAARQAKGLFLEALRASPLLSPEALKAHQRRVMAEQFKALSPDLLARFVELYTTDFALFGYQAKPRDIFGA